MPTFSGQRPKLCIDNTDDQTRLKKMLSEEKGFFISNDAFRYLETRFTDSLRRPIHRCRRSKWTGCASRFGHWASWRRNCSALNFKSRIVISKSGKWNGWSFSVSVVLTVLYLSCDLASSSWLDSQTKRPAVFAPSKKSFSERGRSLFD